MEGVIKKYEHILTTAKDFDSWLESKVKEHPLVVEVSAKLSLMIKEAEIVLREKLENFNKTIQSEQARVDKLANDVKLREDKLNKDEASYKQRYNIYLANLSKFEQDIDAFRNISLVFTEEQKKLKERIDLLNIKEIHYKDREEAIIRDEKRIAKEQQDIDLAYEDIFKKQEKINQEENRIKGLSISLAELDKKMRELEILILEIDRKKIELTEQEEEIAVKMKNLNDKEINLNAYKSEIEFQNAKFKAELIEEKRKLGIKI